MPLYHIDTEVWIFQNVPLLKAFSVSFYFTVQTLQGWTQCCFLCLFVCFCSEVNTSNRLSFVEQRVFNLIDVILLLNDSLKHIQGNNMYVCMYDQSKFDYTWKHKNNKCVFWFLTHFSQTEHNILSSVTIIYFSDTYILAYLNLCYRLCYIYLYFLLSVHSVTKTDTHTVLQWATNLTKKMSEVAKLI